MAWQTGFVVKFMKIVGCWMTYLMLLCLSHVTEVCCKPMKCDCWTHFYVFNFCNTFKFINFNEKILLHPNHLTSPMVLWGQATKKLPPLQQWQWTQPSISVAISYMTSQSGGYSFTDGCPPTPVTKIASLFLLLGVRGSSSAGCTSNSSAPTTEKTQK